MTDIQVSIDRDFARFGSKSYAINKINSVDLRQRHPHGQTPVFILGFLAVICLLAIKGDNGLEMTCLAVVFGALAFAAWKKSQIVEYQLFLMTSSSEEQAITSSDRDMI